jgi:tetratricopeptide (TPR) repeat protein
MSRGDYRTAASLLREQVKTRSGDAESLFALGVCLSQTGDLPDAEDALRRYVRLRPADPDGHAVLGLVLHSAGKNSEARPELRRALQLQPANVEAAKALAHIESLDLNFAAVRTALRPVKNSPEFDATARFQLAGAEAALGNWAPARVELDALLSATTTPACEVFLLASTAALRMGDIPDSLRYCESGVRQYPNEDRLTAACLASQQSKAFEDRLNERLAALRRTPDQAGEAIAIGRLLTDSAGGKNERLQTAGLELLRSALQRAPADPSAHYNLGRALRLARQPSEALVELDRALALAVDTELRVLALMHKAQSHESLGQSEDAAAAYSLLGQVNRTLQPPLSVAAFAHCEFLSARGDEAAAGAAAAEILRWDPMYLPARLVLARQLESRGDTPGAIREAERVVAFAPPDDGDARGEAVQRQAHTLLLRLHAAQGRRDLAARHKAWLESHKSGQSGSPR